MNNQVSTITAQQERPNAGLMLMNPVVMQEVYKFAEVMASGSATVPKHLHGNVADCMALTMQAMQWGMFPFAVAQKTHLINGVLGYEAQLVSAVVNSSGVVQDRFHFDWFGPWENVIGKFEIRKGDKGEYRVPGWKLAEEAGCGVRVWATLTGESEPRVLELLLAQARTRNSTLWADDPKQQLAYLAQKRWARLYAPDVILGVYTRDELEDAPEREINAAPQSTSPAPVKSSLKNKKAAKPEPVADVVAEQKQDEPAAPDFGDDDTNSGEYTRLMDELSMCSENSDFKRWIAEVKELFTAGTDQYTQLVTAYNDRVAVVKAQHEQAQQGA